MNMYRQKLIRSILSIAALAVSGLSAGAEFDCVIEPRQMVDVRASVAGLIDQIHVDRGSLVKAGQVVATLDSGLERANAELARFRSAMTGAVKSGESRVEFATLKSDRREELHTKKFVSAQDRDEAVTEKRLAVSQLQETRDEQRLAELEYKRATEQLRLRSIRSPVSGIVVERLMHPGELADNQDARKPILRIADISVLHVETLLPLEAYGKIKSGQSVQVRPESPIGGKYTARVQVIDKLVDAASGTFGVRLTLANPKLAIPAGIKCKVEFAGVNLPQRSNPYARYPRPGGSSAPGLRR